MSELPIIEETRPANVVDSQVIVPQLRKVSDKFGFHIGAVIADWTLDSAKVLSFVIRDLKAKQYIARNKRREKDFPISKDGNRICLAGFEMIYWGKYKEKRPKSSLSAPLSILRNSEQSILTAPGCIPSLPGVLVVLPTSRW